jgi:hypothetical protein
MIRQYTSTHILNYTNITEQRHGKPTLSLLSANRRPMFPKHTQLQNRTLAIQVATPMLSAVTLMGQGKLIVLIGSIEEFAAGAGTILGLNPRRRAVPVRPTVIERRKPVLL